MSTILVDNLTGKTSAGDITVTSEGGAATQSLQQGLAKAWCHYDGDAATVVLDDSLNHASITDLGTGRQSVTFTNSMSSTFYASQVTGSTSRHGDNDAGSHATSGITYEYNAPDGSFSDTQQGQGTIHGDLA
jgi:hypothetical protein